MQPSIDIDIIARSQLATWWILQELKRPEAEALWERVRGEGPARAADVALGMRRLLPEWCGADPIRSRLARLLAAEFARQAEARTRASQRKALHDLRVTNSAIKEIRDALAHVCIEFVLQKYDDSVSARAFGAALVQVAVASLDLGYLPIASAARAILSEASPELRTLRALHDKLQIPQRLRRSVMAYAERGAARALSSTGADPLLTLLGEFFAVNDGWWDRFFDADRNLKRKKLPHFLTLQERLVENLLDPRRRGLAVYPSGFELSRSGALDLAAGCLKKAFNVFPRGYNGESLRVKIYLTKKKVRRAAAQGSVSLKK